jgi:hypothetical protein
MKGLNSRYEDHLADVAGALTVLVRSTSESS